MMPERSPLDRQFDVAIDREVDGLFARAVAAERAGQLEIALDHLERAIAALSARDEFPQYVYEWRARLETALGRHDLAELSLQIAQRIAIGDADDDLPAEATAPAAPSVRVRSRAGVFRMNVARAENAIAALDLEAAAGILAGLRGDGPALGDPAPERCDQLIAWLAGLAILDRPLPNLAVLRSEAALAIADLWAQRGKYRSALRLIESFGAELAGAAIDLDEVRLFEIELRIDAGQFARARDAVAQLGDGGDAIAGIRRAIVRARLALTTGTLADALACLNRLEAAPASDPALFAMATAARAAVLVELNLWRTAHDAVTRATEQLGAAAAVQPLVDLLARVRAAADARGRSVLAVWELPVGTAERQRSRRDARPTGFAAELLAPPRRLTAAWTAHANHVIAALEADDVAAAAEHHARLAELARGIESDYVAARVRLSAAMVAYCRARSTALLTELCAIADALHHLGARGAEAQATRYAAWASARLGRTDDYVALAQRSSDLIEDIARELPPAERTLYLLNKSNGRDDLVAGVMRELLDGGPADGGAAYRRRACGAFRIIAPLTHWPIDHAFGDRDAAKVLHATPDVAAAWVREQLLAPPPRGRRGLLLRSAWSLWRVPRHTLILHYYVLADRSYVFRLAHRHIDVKPLPVGRLQLRRDMQSVLASPDDLAGLAEDTGIAGALEQFPGIRHLVIVPHDAIAGVPFAALPVGGTPLCTKVAITQIDRLDRLRRPRWLRRPRPCTAIGLASYDGAARDLRHAEHEARAVAALTGGDPALVSERASCDGAVAALQRAAWLHVAAHGVVDDEDPARSGILLRDGAGYRALTLHELRRADARRVELVTLATCRSADSPVLPGGVRICLPSALLDAGARGVIAALWPIEDEPSVTVMETLYRHLRTARPSRALSRAQTELRDRPASQWAGLVFYGND